MKSTINLILLLVILTITGCKKENTFTDYKFAEKDLAISCKNQNNALINEALLSFENDIAIYYANYAKNDLAKAYSLFLSSAHVNKLNYLDVVSPHSIKVFKALKNEAGLWDANNPNSHINYKADLLTCLVDNFKDKKLKTTYNALVTTNSMKSTLLVAPIAKNYRSIIFDKNLSTYIALDFYYAKFFDIDLSSVTEKPAVEQKVDFNKRPTRK